MIATYALQYAFYNSPFWGISPSGRECLPEHEASFSLKRQQVYLSPIRVSRTAAAMGALHKFIKIRSQLQALVSWPRK